MTGFSVDLFDRRGQRIDEIDAGHFQAVVRKNERGAWSLRTPRSELSVDPAAVDGVCVFDGDRKIFDGVVGVERSGFGGIEVTRSGRGSMMKFSGPDGWGVLGFRLASINPAYPDDPAAWLTEADERSGIGSAVAAAYVEANFGANATPDRRIPVEIIDPVVGATGQWSARAVPLDEHVKRIARESGFVCRPRYNADRTFIITFAMPAELVDNVLSEDSDLTDTAVRIEPASASWLLGAGSGTGVDRDFTIASDQPIGLDRREQVVELNSSGTQVSYAELVGFTEAELLRRNGSRWVSTKLTDDAAQSLEWLVDYDVGDLIPLDIEEEGRLLGEITAAEIVASPKSSTVRPVIGQSVQNLLDGLVTDVDGIQEDRSRQLA